MMVGSGLVAELQARGDAKGGRALGPESSWLGWQLAAFGILHFELCEHLSDV